MICTKLATRKDGVTFPCGQCLNCRINRKRDWQARLLLEAAVSKYSMFITLTIGVDDAKDSEYCTYLDKPTCQRFWKRLRDRCKGVEIRYLLVGEYGTKRGRAHYHALVFSSAPLSNDLVAAAWGLGHVDFGDVQQESIDYVLAYVLKTSDDRAGLSEEERRRRLAHPEFRLHSRGLGRGALFHLTTAEGTGELVLNREFRVLGRRWPIGRYFRTKWRGATCQELYESGRSDPVAEREDCRVERMLHESLRALPPGSEAYSQVRDQILARRDAQVKRLQGRRIRDYYKDLHHLNRKPRNETF